MRFSNREQYGLRAMVEFARRYGGGPVSLGDIATAEGISLSYLEQIVSSLRRAGLLTSWRGAAGGYSLAASPATVTAGDVFRALEGPLVPVLCANDDAGGAPCELEGRCAARTVWRKVRHRLEDALDSTTLADLIG